MNDVTDGGSDYREALPDFALKVHEDLQNECGFVYDRSKSLLRSKTLSFYPKGIWQCRLELEPQTVRLRSKRRQLNSRTYYYFLYCPSDTSLPIMPLGNDTAWVLRANKRYVLDLTGKAATDDELLLNPVSEAADEAMMRRVIEYLNYYYNFTRYDFYPGGPMRLRVPRHLGDLKLSDASDEVRWSIKGALWRFRDQVQATVIRPALKTITRFIKLYQADVPIQVGSVLWRLRVSISLGSGYVRLYGRVPFFYSPHLEPPSPDRVEMLPIPRGIFWREPWLLLPERLRNAVGAFTYFTIAVSWLLAVLASVAFPLSYLLNPAIVGSIAEAIAAVVPLGWRGLWWIALYSIGVFACLATFVFQFEGGLRRAARTAPSVLQLAYKALDKWQRAIWDWFKPNLETPLKKASTSALWLLASTIFLILVFTTLQIAQEPQRFASTEKGLLVLQTFFGHATIAFPGLPYVLGAFGFDPLVWLQDPAMTSPIVLGFRVMMLIVVFRAFWKLLGFTSPRILYRDNRRLEFEVSRRKS